MIRKQFYPHLLFDLLLVLSGSYVGLLAKFHNKPTRNSQLTRVFVTLRVFAITRWLSIYSGVHKYLHSLQRHGGTCCSLLRGFMSFVLLVPVTNLMWHKYRGQERWREGKSAYVGRHSVRYALYYCYSCRCRSVHYKIQKIFDLISA